MAIFGQIKKLITARQRQVVEKSVTTLHGVGESDASTPVADISEIITQERNNRVSQLTPYEYELYLLLLEGFTLKESAKQLSIKYSIANTQIKSIYEKLSVKSRRELIINYHNINGDCAQAP